jgi:hypothetical protein
MNVTSYIKRTIHLLLKKGKGTLQPLGAAKHAHSGRITRRVAHALALKPRGAISKDVLAVNRLVIGLRVEWFARDVHPWDRDLPERRKAELFAQQCLEDVDAAIPRLFEQLPEIDVLEIGVLERASKSKIIAGVVHRSDLDAQVGSSLGMRLKTIGINYRCTDLRLEPIV